MTVLQQGRILKPDGPAAKRDLNVLLETIWVGEVICPSQFLILASPDINDGPAIDNRTGGYSSLEPNWGERVVRLSDILLRVLGNGGEVWVFTRGQAGNQNLFLARLCERARERGLGDKLRTMEVEVLSVSGVFGDGFALTGNVSFGNEGPDYASGGIAFNLDPNSEKRNSMRSVLEGLFK